MRTGALGSKIEAAALYGEYYRADFAGVLPSDPALYVGFTRERYKHATRLRALLPGTDIRVFRARFSLSDLQALVARISADAEMWSRQGIDIISAGVAIHLNKVVVGLSLGPEARGDIHKRFTRHYPAMRRGMMLVREEMPWLL